MAPSTPLPPLASETLSAPARPELTGGRRVGVLLSHGLTGNPVSINPWGRYLAEQGYAVEVPLLPGHGTTWEDANTTSWDQWYATITRTFDKLRGEVDTVVVGGLSMGGAIALRLAADRGDQIAGVVVVNPALASRRKDLLALPLLKHVVGGFPAIGNDIKKPGGNEYPYPKTPLKALHSFVQQWKPLIADLPQDHPAAADLPLGRGPRRRLLVGADHHQPGLEPRRHRATARGQLPRGHARQRRPDDLRGVGRVRRARDGDVR